MNCNEYYIESNDGVQLFVRKYFSLESEKTPTLLIIHGMSEHGGRYEHVARHFVDQGWNVIVPDVRGHGKSGGIPTHVSHFRQYCKDVDVISQFFELKPEQTALLGHSMGGLISIRYCQSYPNQVKALMLSSPLLGVRVHIPIYTIVLGKLISLVYPLYRYKSKVDECYTTRNGLILEKRMKDPLIHRSVTGGWYFAMKDALKKAWKKAPELTLPILIVQAGDDYIVDPYAPEPWMAQTSSKDKQFVFQKEHYHEVLNEIDWEETVSFMECWINSRMGIENRNEVCPEEINEEEAETSSSVEHLAS